MSLQPFFRNRRICELCYTSPELYKLCIKLLGQFYVSANTTRDDFFEHTVSPLRVNETIKQFAMKHITLKFSCIAQMLEFIRASRICNYDLSTVAKLLTADLSEEQITLAVTYNATVADRIFSACEN